MGSSLKVRCQTFDKWSGEIVFTSDVQYQNREYRDISIIRISIFGDKDGTFITDECCLLIPSLKPIASFRVLLEGLLYKLINHPELPIRSGARKYLAEIRKFSEVESLIDQAKRSINDLRSDKKNAFGIAKRVLEVMGKIPSNEYVLEFQDI